MWTAFCIALVIGGMFLIGFVLRTCADARDRLREQQGPATAPQPSPVQPVPRPAFQPAPEVRPSASGLAERRNKLLNKLLQQELDEVDGRGLVGGRETAAAATELEKAFWAKVAARRERLDTALTNTWKSTEPEQLNALRSVLNEPAPK